MYCTRSTMQFFTKLVSLVLILLLSLCPSTVFTQNDDLEGHSLQPPYSSYDGRTPYCTPSSPFSFPSTTTQIQKIVINAGFFRQTVKPIGSRHSATGIICTDGTPLVMRNFQDKKLSSDGTATFGSGVKLRDASAFLKRHGRAFIHLPGYDGLTLGGAVGTGAHGSSLVHPASLSEQVVRMSIVDGLGIVRTISGEELNVFRIHLGMLGVLVEITFQTVELFKIVVETGPEDDNILMDNDFVEMARKFDFFQAAWFPATKKVVINKGKFTNDVSLPGEARWVLFTETDEDSALAERNLNDALHKSRNIAGFNAIQENTMLSYYTKVIGRVPIFSEDNVSLPHPAVGYGHDIMAATCDICDWYYGDYSARGLDDSLGCPADKLPAIAARIRKLLTQIPAAITRIQIRFHPASTTLMSRAYGRDTVMLSLLGSATIDGNDPIAGSGVYQSAMQIFIAEYDCRPHWGKNGGYYHTHEIIKKSVPPANWVRFVTAVHSYDPFAVFRNKFSLRFLGFSHEMDTDPRISRCAVADYCACLTDQDCGADQVCAAQTSDGSMGQYKICCDVKIYENKPLLKYDPYNYTSILEAIFY